MGEWTYHTLAQTAERVRPLPGFLWCEEVPQSVTRYVPGLGNVEVARETSTGLYLPPESQESAPLTGKLLVVRRKGDEPEKWNQRWFGRERDRSTTFAEQKIDEGTLLVVRKMAGVTPIEHSRWYQVRYDEVCAIGVPLDEDHPSGLDMLPCPGWVAVRLDPLPSSTDSASGLWIRSEVRAAIDGEGGVWGTVVATARGAERDRLSMGLTPGDRVLLPAHTGCGATEYIEHRGLRFCPEDDVLAVTEGEGTP